MYLNYWIPCIDRGPKWPSARFRSYFGKMVWVPKIMITISLNDSFDVHCYISLDLFFYRLILHYLTSMIAVKIMLTRATLPCECAKLPQSYLTLRNLMDYSPPGSFVQGILQAKILEWVAMPSSRESSWPMDQTCISNVSCIGRRILYH